MAKRPRTRPAAVTAEGTCDSRFFRLKRAFEANFSDGDIGAAICVYLGGKPVVDLWGGRADPKKNKKWQADTLCASFSVSKAFVSTMGHMLIDRGQLDLEEPVAKYWPTFAKHGKDGIKVKHLFEHRAALVNVDQDLKPGQIYDWKLMVRALENSRPNWPYGRAPTYHSMTFGYLLGEVIRRIDGRPVGRFQREEIAGPLNVDFLFGLTAAEQRRCARVVAEARPDDYLPPLPPNPAAAARSLQGVARGDRYNAPSFRSAELGAGSGHGTARGVARFFACLGAGGALDGARLLSKRMRDHAIKFRAGSIDPVFGVHNRFALGLQLNNPPGMPMGNNPRAFGHLGAGGRIGFADPDRQIAFSYLPNVMWYGSGLGPRGTRLVDTLFDCL
ncbi:MAG: class A beta-lactamase-related serine hydrolase [Alphaproteobacteria bacterium]|nr:class A beta-lactamase-related serine hydrolase [Alphaproteobacteria bacterium]